MHRYRTRYCGQILESDIGTIVRLSGWVHRIRDHGGLLFIDLRDDSGLVQMIINPESACFKIAEELRSEWVICIDGDVRRRTDETVNANLATGNIEIFVHKIEVLSEAQDLPLPVFGEPDYPEDIRLKNRFLDLRRETMHHNMKMRSKIIATMRQKMIEAGFSEFSTPILTASSPEGARDFLVPSRIYSGKFYALPQAPQQYKQLIMASGFDRYFQIAPCFRDEDPRADRLPGEFYQLDLEMSFVEQEDILVTIEPIIKDIFETFAEGKPVTQKFPRISYIDSLEKYGSDKPDLRNPILIEKVCKYFRNEGFSLFANILANNPKAEIWALPAKGGGNRSFCDRMNDWAKKEGQAGLAWIFWRHENGAIDALGPVAKNLGPEKTNALRLALNLGDGDAVFFLAGDPKKFIHFAGTLRTRIGQELSLIDYNQFSLCWIVDFPFYEWNEEEKKITFAHNPFSMPQGNGAVLSEKDPLTIKAFQYDMVCNGYEIASGGIRNHLPQIMLKAFQIAGLDQKIVEKQFGGLYRAFHYGVPPHGGLAAGIDRIIMLLLGVKNLREITLFPMNQQGYDLLMNAPCEVSDAQLKELFLSIQCNEK